MAATEPCVTGIGRDRAITQGVDSGLSERTQGTSAHTVVFEIVAELAPSVTAELSPDTELVGELGYDSLGLLELVVALEDALDLPPIESEELAGVDRVADVERVVNEAQARIAATKEPE
jgi:acyl carrier protein